MNTHRRVWGICAVAVLLGAPAQANIIDTIPNWSGDRSNGWDKIAQTLIVPGDKSILSTFELGVGSEFADRTFTLRVFARDRSLEHTVGPELFASAPTAAPVGGVQFIEFTLNLALTPGSEYAVIADWDQEGNGNGVAFIVGSPFADGYANFSSGDFEETWSFNQNSGFELAFRAVFNVPAPGAIALLGTAGLFSRRRRRA